jgi:hypothetical protein
MNSAVLANKAKVEKWSIPNPMRAPGESSAILSAYRHGRDEIDKSRRLVP